MKIAIVSGNYGGGAGIAARRLSEALRRTGNEADFFFVNCNHQYENFEVKLNEYRLKSSRLINTELPRTPLSNTWFTKDNTSCVLLDRLMSYDVVHFHWISGMISHEDIVDLLQNKVKIFWTLHDANAFTGGCHYTAGCTNYVNGCYDCPQVLGKQSKEAVFNQYISRLNNALQMKNVTIITPSEWLAQMARQSLMFRNNTILCIRNAFPGDFISRLSATNNTNSSLKENVFSVNIILGSLTNNERRKGIDFGLLSIDIFLELEKNFSANIHILGKGASIQSAERKHVVIHDNINTDNIENVLALCDISIVPSLEENYSNFIVESIVAGVPVVCFNVGGNQEIVRHRKNGFLVPRFKCAFGLAKGIQFLARNKFKYLQKDDFNSTADDVNEFKVVEQLLKAYERY